MANVENASGETPTQVASKPVASNQDETLNVLKDILSLMESVDKQLKNHGARLANIENRALKSENESATTQQLIQTEEPEEPEQTEEPDAIIEPGGSKPTPRDPTAWRKDIEFMPYETSTADVAGQSAPEVNAFLRKNLGNVWAIPPDGRVDFGFMKQHLIMSGDWKCNIEKFRKLEDDLVGSGGDFWIEDYLWNSYECWTAYQKYSLRPHKLNHQPRDSLYSYDNHVDLDQYANATSSITEGFWRRMDHVIGRRLSEMDLTSLDEEEKEKEGCLFTIQRLRFHGLLHEKSPVFKKDTLNYNVPSGVGH